MKLMASIVAISGIHLLKSFMEIGETSPERPFDPIQLRWLVIIHLTFVASGVLLALMDWITEGPTGDRRTIIPPKPRQGVPRVKSGILNLGEQDPAGGG